MKKHVLTWTIQLIAIIFFMSAVMPATVAAASSSDPVKTGFFLPLTGGAAAGGKKELIGMELAVEEINQMGGVLNGRLSQADCGRHRIAAGGRHGWCP